MSLSTKVKRFTSNQANAGAAGTMLIVNVIDHGLEHNDFTPLGWLLSGLNSTDRNRVRTIVGLCLAGVKMTKDDKQPCGYKFKRDSNANVTENMAGLRACADVKVSFRSSVIMEKIDPDNGSADQSAFDMEKQKELVGKRVCKFIAESREAGITMDHNAYMSMIRQATQHLFEPADA